MPPPYHDPALDITDLDVDWSLGGDPQLTWTAPGTADHIIVYSSNDGSWALGDAISGSLPGDTTSFSATNAGQGDSAWYYWVVAFNSTGFLAGQTRGVVCWQNTSTQSDFQPGNHSPPIGPLAQPLLMPILSLIGGSFYGTGTVEWGGNQCKDAYNFHVGQPNNPLADAVQIQIYNTDGTHLNDILDGPCGSGGSAAVPRVGAAGVGGVGPGGSMTPANQNVKTPVTHNTGNLPEQNQVYPNFIIDGGGLCNPNGDNWGTLTGTSITFAASYMSPPGSSFNGVGIGGGEGSPPTPSLFTPINPPVPTPLPCTPCCWTTCPCTCLENE